MIPYIQELHIHQYRGLHNLHLSGLGQINLFVGGNNSGKTSVLEAIASFCRPMDPWEWINAAQNREIKSSRTSTVESLKWLFPQTNLGQTNGLYEGTIVLVGEGAFPVREVTATLNEFFVEQEQKDEYGISMPIRGADLTLEVKIETSRPMNILSSSQQVVRETFQFREDERFIQRKQSIFPMLPIGTITPPSHRVEHLQIHRLSETTLQELKSSVITMLQLFDPSIEDIEIVSQLGVRPTLYIKQRGARLTPLSVFGDGMRRMLLMATTMPLCQNGVLLIDELETAIHTQALQKTFDWLIRQCIQKNIQLVTTTHSLETLDAVLAVCKRDVDLVVHRLEHTPSQTIATKLDKETLTILREELGQEVRW